MIATGTDVKPLECLIFMRDVKTKNYYEQMKGRGTRTISLDDLRKVTPSAKYTKDHFIIIDAFHIEKDDFNLSPFDAKGGLGKMWQLFGDNTYNIINELNEALAA